MSIFFCVLLNDNLCGINRETDRSSCFHENGTKWNGSFATRITLLMFEFRNLSFVELNFLTNNR